MGRRVWEGRQRHSILLATVNDEDFTQRHGESYLPQNALIIWKNDLRFIETHLEFSQAFYLHLFPKEASLGFFPASSQYSTVKSVQLIAKSKGLSDA